MAGVSYQEHLDFLIRQEAGARAERYGFVDAKLLFAGTIEMFENEYERMRYQQGYEDGKAILSVEEAS